jgi:Molybdenum cofactor biosynthesis enzyme
MRDFLEKASYSVPGQELQGFSVAERLPTHGLESDIEALILMEREVPVVVGMDTSLRPKILDSCGMTCTFCHNEGTPVAGTRQGGNFLLPNPTYKGGRVSVFEESNGVNFVPGVMMPDESFISALKAMRDSIGIRELHLTGGEPTLHRDLPGIIRSARELGFSVKMTSNGENGANVLKQCAEAGLEKVNFSIFGTTPEELAEVQHSKYNNVKLAEVKLRSLRRSIDTALENGIGADANIVMSDSSHAERVKRIITEYDNRVSVRILNDLDAGDDSYLAIYRLMAELDAVPVQLYVAAGSSNSRVKYMLPNGREIFFKQIRRTTLPETCEGCSLNNDEDCKEGYYGVRLYTDTEGSYKVGVCLQRMDLTMNVDEFVNSSIAQEINDLRMDEFEQLTNHYAQRIVRYGEIDE